MTSGLKISGTLLLGRSTNANVVHYEAKIGPQGSLQPAERWLSIGRCTPRMAIGKTSLSLEKKRAFGISVAAA